MSKSGNNQKVLIVDDTRSNIDVLRRVLDPLGYKIMAALDGESALKVVARNQPDLVLMDIMMPGMDGYETTRRFKAQENLRDVPIIFITAKGETQDIVRGFEVGGADYITKPFNGDEVIARIKTHLKLRELIKALSLEKMEKAHMAEIATSVLHNAINICNSLSISIEEIGGILKNSKLQYLEHAGVLLRDKKGALSDFMEKDPQAADLLTFYERIGNILNQEREEIFKELAHFRERTNFVTQVIEAQQEFSKGNLKPEPVSLRQLVDQMLTMQTAILRVPRLEIVRNYDSFGAVLAVKSKLMQVFMNLIKNALESMAAVDGPRILTVSVGEVDDHMDVTISDTGKGVDPGHLARLFTFGFTTKDAGHGFGLSHCKRIIEEAGGAITAHSDGPGTGASFHLTFPLAP